MSKAQQAHRERLKRKWWGASKQVSPTARKKGVTLRDIRRLEREMDCVNVGNVDADFDDALDIVGVVKKAGAV